MSYNFTYRPSLYTNVKRFERKRRRAANKSSTDVKRIKVFRYVRFRLGNTSGQIIVRIDSSRTKLTKKKKYQLLFSCVYCHYYHVKKILPLLFPKFANSY